MKRLDAAVAVAQSSPVSMEVLVILRANHHHTTGPVFAPHLNVRG